MDIVTVVFWFISGYVSFLYWWFKEFCEITVSDLVFGIIPSFLGPIAFILGAIIYDKHSIGSYVVFRKRK